MTPFLITRIYSDESHDTDDSADKNISNECFSMRNNNSRTVVQGKSSSLIARCTKYFEGTTSIFQSEEIHTCE